MAEPPEQALRAENEEGDHGPEHDRIGPDRRDHQAGQRLNLRQKQAGDDGAPDRAHAADDDDGEGEQDEVAPHGREHRIDRREQDAGETGERDTKGKCARIDQRHRHAERGRHVAVEGGRTHHRAETGAVDDIGDGADDRRADHDQEEPVVRHDDAGELGRARDRRRRALGVGPCLLYTSRCV